MVRTNEEWSTFFIYAYLCGKYGSRYIERYVNGTVPMTITKNSVRSLLIPRPTREFHDIVSNLVKQSIVLADKSKTLYNQSQVLLEKELGMDQFELEKPKNFVSHFSEMVENRRFDAQCYKPDYIEYEKYLRKRGNFDYLRNVLTSSVKGQQATTLLGGDMEYVSIKDIKGIEIYSEEYCKYSASLRVAQKEDILLAITGATIGKVGIVSRSTNLAFSGDLLSLKANERIDPYYLLAVMSNPIGQSQCQRWITGSTNGHLSPIDVNKFVIPRLVDDSEKKISALLQSSILSFLESERLMKQAIIRVEDFIEGVIG